MAVNRSKVKYFRNMTQNPIRVDSVNFEAYGKRDVAEVAEEIFNSAKFAPSIGTLIQEINEAEYKERLSEAYQKTSIVKPGYTPPQVISIRENNRGAAEEYKQDVELEGYAPVTGLRREISVDQYQGADFATGSRVDPGAGKTLTELRNQGA